LWSNFVGAPNLYWVWAVPQDGIAKPADFNASASTWLKALWNGTATGSKAGTLTGPDASGYYTATLTGVVVTDDAVMLTGGVGYVYGSGSPPLTQTNLPDYPVTASTAVPGTFTGGLAVPAPNVYKVATGYTGRRAIVDNAKCKNCHEALGLFTEAAFHSGQRNDGTTCSWCHNPNLTSSGWAADSTNFVHAIHGASKRTVDYTWHAASATAGFFNIGYPGILKNCETCHVAGTYDFSASASSSALPNRLFRTVAAKPRSGTTLTADVTLSPYTDSVTSYGAGFSVTTTSGTTTAVTTAAATTTLVISPIMTTCVSCHDGVGASGVDAVVHMKQNGGQFYAARGTNPASQETCMLCHGPTGVAPIAAVHAR
jgi:OmcA/MtrC family decaheme c-type cytochrome